MLFQAPGGFRLRWRVREPSLRRFRGCGRERLRAGRGQTCPSPVRRSDSCEWECSRASLFHLRFAGFNLNERVEGVNWFHGFVEKSGGVGIGVRFVELTLDCLPKAAKTAEAVIDGGSFVTAVDHAIGAL